MDPSTLVTSLQSDGNAVTIRTFLAGPESPLASWDAWNLHLFVTLSLALVVSIPSGSLFETLPLALVAIGVSSCAAIAICAVQVTRIVISAAHDTFGIRVASVPEVRILDMGGDALVAIGMLLVPAAVFLVSYMTRSGKSTFSPGRMGLVLACVTGALIGMSRTKAPDSSDYHAGLRRLQRLNPGSAIPLLGLGALCEGEGDLDASLQAYRSALALDDRLAEAHFGLGNVLFKKSLYAPALEAYQETLRLSPGHVSARQNLGITLVQLGRYGEALPAFAEVLRAEPRHAAAHHDLGFALLRLERPCEALPQLQQGASLDRRFATDPAVNAEIVKLKAICSDHTTRRRGYESIP